MRVADFLAARLHYLGCTDVYMVTGGAAMHLNDAFGSRFKGKIRTLHHEQSCAIAAESHARVSGIPAIVNVTAGPGAINAINGVFGAYVDSIPMIVVSGQAKRETLVSSYRVPNLRQLGDQEVDIISMVSGITKHAILLTDPLAIAEELDRCFQIATTGRPGPVWLDVPIDVQSYLLPAEYTGYLRSEISDTNQEHPPFASQEQIREIAHHILNDERPVLYVGSGIRLAKQEQQLHAFLEKWPLATVTGWNSNDLLPDNHACYSGRPGTVGNRAGNFAVQYSKCVIIVGCRLNIRQVSFNWQSFARDAWKCHVDIDKAELDKPTLNTQLRVHSTVDGFFQALDKELEKLLHQQNLSKEQILSHWSKWRAFNQKNLYEYSVVKGALSPKENAVNPYRLVHALTTCLPSGSITVCADGTACVVGFQAAVIKDRQRLFHNSGCASMGYELPAAIGAHHASSQTIICIAGDGSIMMNLQEMAYIGGHSLPIKIILLNNHGYHSIRQTQRNYFPGNPVGCGEESGLPFPDFATLCAGFAIQYDKILSEDHMHEMIKMTLDRKGPSLLEVFIDLEQDFSPKLSSKKLADGTMITAELEDMTPLLGDQLLQSIRDEAYSIR